MAHVNGVSTMGAVAGGINMITGKSEPLGSEQSYDDWLMEMLIKHGIGNEEDDLKSPWNKIQAASAIGHVRIKEVEKMSGWTHIYTFTPKAQRYLDIMNKENE